MGLRRPKAWQKCKSFNRVKNNNLSTSFTLLSKARPSVRSDVLKLELRKFAKMLRFMEESVGYITKNLNDILKANEKANLKLQSFELTPHTFEDFHTLVKEAYNNVYKNSPLM